MQLFWGMKTSKDQPENLNPDNPNNAPAVNPGDPIPPAITTPDLTPTAAEYARDAQLEAEDREKALQRNAEVRQAAKDGELPPGAQSLEDARQAREDAKKPKDEQDKK